MKRSVERVRAHRDRAFAAAPAPAGRVSGPDFAGPENWASRGRWSGAETGLVNAEAHAQGARFCGQAVQNLCFIWVQDIGVGPRLARGQFWKKSAACRGREFHNK